MKRLLLIGLILSLFSIPLHAADVPIFPSGPIFKLNGLQWGVGTAGGFNQNFFFTPNNLNEAVCIFVINNNPTSGHFFTAAINVTGDPSNITPSDGTWQNANVANLSVPLAPSTAQGLGATVNGVAKVSISLIGSTVQAGSPDTANIIISQNPNGPCFSGNAFASGIPNTNTSFNALQSISDGLGQAYFLTGSVVNPTNNVLTVNAGSGNRTQYFDRAIVSATVAGSITIQPISSNGVGCPGQTLLNEKILNGSASTGLGSIGTCTTTPPTVAYAGGGIALLVPANTPVVIDLRGFIGPNGTTTGIQVISPIVGTVNAALFWYEK